MPDLTHPERSAFLTTVGVFQTSYGKNEEYFLFATIFDATMIDKRFGDKPMYFEISVGNAGNSMDGHNQTSKELTDSDSDDNLGETKCFAFR